MANKRHNENPPERDARMKDNTRKQDDAEREADNAIDAMVSRASKNTGLNRRAFPDGG